MNRWANIVWSIALVATLGWLGAGALGYRVHDQRSLTIHTLASFVALLALLLAHGWMAVFALASRRFVARASGSDSPALASAGRAVLFVSLLAIVAALAQFTVSNALFPARLKAKGHAQAAALSASAIALALVVEMRALRRHARAVAEIGSEVSASESDGGGRAVGT